jgi:hypothetical protein
MDFDLKFKTLVATLKAVLPTIEIDAHDDRRKRDALTVIQRYTHLLKQRKMNARAAFLGLLRETVILLSYDISHDNGLEEIAELNFRQALKDAVFDIDESGGIMRVMRAASKSREPLVSQQEYLFVYLYENARRVLSGGALARLNEIANRSLILLTKKSDEQLSQANWQMAVLLYQQCQVATEESRDMLQDILFGYLTNKTNHAEIRQAREGILKTITPLSLDAYIYYCMIGGTLPESIDSHFFGAMLALLKERSNEQPPTPYLQTYDAAFDQICPTLILEANAKFQGLADNDEKVEMKEFIDGLHELHALVRRLLSSMVSAVNREINENRKALEQWVAKLTVLANQLFDQGKPHSTWRLILGIGLMVVGAGLLVAGIAALVACPLAIALVGTAAAVNVGIASTTIGSVSVLGGAISFFKGLPAPSKSEAKHLIAVCQRAGLVACS